MKEKKKHVSNLVFYAQSTNTAISWQTIISKPTKIRNRIDCVRPEKRLEQAKDGNNYKVSNTPQASFFLHITGEELKLKLES